MAPQDSEIATLEVLRCGPFEDGRGDLRKASSLNCGRSSANEQASTGTFVLQENVLVCLRGVSISPWNFLFYHDPSAIETLHTALLPWAILHAERICKGLIIPNPTQDAAFRWMNG